MKAFTGGVLTEAQHVDYVNWHVDQEIGPEAERKARLEASVKAQAEEVERKFYADWRGFYDQISGIIPEALIPFAVLPDFNQNAPYPFIAGMREQRLDFCIPGYEPLTWLLHWDGQYFHPVQWEVHYLAVEYDEARDEFGVVQDSTAWDKVPDDGKDGSWARALILARDLNQNVRPGLEAEAQAKTQKMMRSRLAEDETKAPVPAITVTGAEMRLVQALRDLLVVDDRELPY